jgi:3-methyladenine DNA glycosylase AlkD
MTANDAIRALRGKASERAAKNLRRFFKTGPGEYGEGDKFLGLSVPQTRAVAREFADLPLTASLKLLRSPWHEVRQLALMRMVRRYEKGDDAEQVQVYRAYLANTAWINNWDLVDLSAHEIVGAHLLNRSRKPLYRLVKSRSLWERRIAMVSTHAFIRERDLRETFALAELLLKDRHDLMHKATGWMLREAGKRDLDALRGFLDRHCKAMPRTMLRYAIEKMGPAERERYMRPDARS